MIPHYPPKHKSQLEKTNSSRNCKAHARNAIVLASAISLETTSICQWMRLENKNITTNSGAENWKNSLQSILHWFFITGIFKTTQPPTDKIHDVKVAMDCRQSNTIPAFWVFYSENCLHINFNQSVIANESFRSDWIYIKTYPSKIFIWLTTFRPWILMWVAASFENAGKAVICHLSIIHPFICLLFVFCL